MHNAKPWDPLIKLLKTFVSARCNSEASKYAMYIIQANAIFVSKSTMK